jgi:hypothetical protein
MDTNPARPPSPWTSLSPLKPHSHSHVLFLCQSRKLSVRFITLGVFYGGLKRKTLPGLTLSPVTNNAGEARSCRVSSLGRCTTTAVGMWPSLSGHRRWGRSTALCSYTQRHAHAGSYQPFHYIAVHISLVDTHTTPINPAHPHYRLTQVSSDASLPSYAGCNVSHASSLTGQPGISRAVAKAQKGWD